jgi:hypothetical protein
MMKTRHLLPALGIFATLAVASTSSTAALVIGNLTGDARTTASTLANSLNSNGKAFGFTMPAGESYSLDSVTLSLEVVGSSAGTVSLVADLFNDVGGNPGGPSILSFNVPTFPSGASALADYILTPSVPFTLMAGTTYWFAATGTISGLGTFEWTQRGTNTLPTGIATAVGYRFENSYPPTGTSDTFTSLQIDGTPVPVPAPLALVLAGLTSIGALRLRRRSNP